MKQSLLTLLFVLVYGFVQAQTITGKVTDAATKEGLPGVSVFLKGTTQGTITDVDGAFTITAGKGATLVFQLLGFEAQEIAIDGQTTLDVALKNDQAALKEVVVVGYGTQEKREVTGAIVGVKAEDIKNIPVPSFESALQGRTTGVQITSGSGKVGQGFNIRVRGSSSLSASNQPLYVVDGIMITSSSVNSNDEGVNPLADINVNDIERIEVLKDASAAAIYGARASNGVVVITTKRGKAGKTNVNIGFSTGFSNPTRKRKFLNAGEYKTLFLEAARWAEGQGYLDGTAEEELDNNIGTGWRDSSIDTNWEDLAFQQGGFQQLDVNASGGNEKTQFYVGGSYTDQSGIIVGNRFKRLSAKIAVDNKINDRLTVGGNLMIARSHNFRAAADNQFNNQLQLVALPPNQKPYLDSGRPNMGTLYYNALAELTDAKNTATSYRNLTTLYGAYKILPSLSFRSELGLDLLYLEEETFNGRITAPNTGAPEGIGTHTTSLVSNYTFTNTLNYTKTFNEAHNIDALFGVSYQESNSKFSFVDGRNFATDNFKKIANAAVIASGSSSGTDFNFASYFMRANYKFKDKYLVSLSGRVDGSSRFPSNSRFGFFPAAGLGWIMSEEAFLKDNPIVSFLKLRAGYGLTGNAEVGNFDYLSTYGSNAYGSQAGLTPGNFTSTQPKWETTGQLDTGLEIGLLKDRISISIDYYNKNTRDLLLLVNVPATSGYTTQLRNIGKISNHGFEFSVDSRNLVGDFKWNTNFNLSINRNKVISTSGIIIAPGNRSRTLNEAREGEPIGVFYGVKYAGVDKQNGDALYYMADGKTTNDYSAASRQVIGNPNPKFIGGLTNSFSYKGFELNLFAQFVYGNDIYNMAGGFMSANGDYFDNQTKDQLDRWQKPGDVTDVPQARLYGGNGTNISSRYVHDGSYLRLKTVTLAYNFPKEWLSKAKISNARLYITAQNLLTLASKKFRGWDPELSSGFTQTGNQSSNIIMGNDFYTAPQARTVIFGVNLSF